MTETHLERKLRQLGLSPEVCSNGQKRLHYKLYFPRPPFNGVEYTAAKQRDGYNFVGLLLGHGGSTLQRIQRQSGTKVEVHDENGNLNGNHPSASSKYLHALIQGDSQGKLQKAVDLVREVLKPSNTEYKPVIVKPNSQALLEPVLSEFNDADDAFAEDNSSQLSSVSSASDLTKIESGRNTRSPTPVSPEPIAKQHNSSQNHVNAIVEDQDSPLIIRSPDVVSLKPQVQSLFSQQQSTFSTPDDTNTIGNVPQEGWSAWNHSSNLYETLTQATKTSVELVSKDYPSEVHQNYNSFAGFQTPHAYNQSYIADFQLHEMEVAVGRDLAAAVLGTYDDWAPTPVRFSFESGNCSEASSNHVSMEGVRLGSGYGGQPSFGLMVCGTEDGNSDEGSDTTIQELVDLLKIPLK